MYPLGSKERPIIVKVSSQTRAEKVATICEAYKFGCLQASFFFLQFFNSDWVSWIFINCNHTRFRNMKKTQSFQKKMLRSLMISKFAQIKIECASFRIYDIDTSNVLLLLYTFHPLSMNYSFVSDNTELFY